MTRLTYMVGNEEIVSYNEAKRRSAETGKPAVPKYTLMVEEQRTDPERLAKIQKYFAEKRLQRA